MNADMKRLCDAAETGAFDNISDCLGERAEAVVRAVLTEMKAMTVVQYNDATTTADILCAISLRTQVDRLLGDG